MRQGNPFAYSFNLMTVPSADPSLVALPLPSDEELIRVIGKSYDSDKTRHCETVTRKLILIISWFNLLSCFINACRVPLETIDKIGNESAPVR
jgi:hypothetical protein